MSFILDALRKAERDRNLGQAPQIADVALAPDGAPGATPAGRRQALRWLIALAVLLIATIAGVLAWRNTTRVAAVPAPVVEGVVTATVRGPAPTERTAAEAGVTRRALALPEPEPAVPSTPALPEDETLQSLDDLDASPGDATDVTTDEAATVAAIANAAPPVDFIARPADRGSSPTDASPARPAVALALDENIAREGRSASVVDDTQALSALPLQDMPSDYRRDFPALSVEVHVWDGEPSRRFVLIGGKRYVEGQALAEGPQLLQITQDGLVLDYRGSRVAYSLQ